ncbi:MAG: nucleotide-binding protein [Chloroflexi bacterium]|nr:nucleotide-binding protein [Chloroflexota bacterium]
MSERIFVSTPNDSVLDVTQFQIKTQVLKLIKRAGFEPQEFSVSGLPAQLMWNYENVNQVLHRCQGAVILGLERWQAGPGQGIHGLATAFNHFEGALALAHQLPTLVIAERGTERQGIFFLSAGQNTVYLLSPSMIDWHKTKTFRNKFKAWRTEVTARFQVFAGYCAQANPTAQAIIKEFKKQGVSVMDWQKHFRPGRSILEEVERASQTCMAGVFLFTCDDALITQNKKRAAPRDNVILEAGYFLHAKGKERALIICEKGVKVPADLGGNIYIELEDRHDITTIKTRLSDFIQDRL